jgi:hypothetical protein
MISSKLMAEPQPHIHEIESSRIQNKEEPQYTPGAIL